MSRIKMKPGRQRTEAPVIPELLISGTPQPTGLVGNAWSFAPVVEGGQGPFTHSFVTGGPPAGTSLNTSTGVTSGTLTTAQTISGTVQRVTDSSTPTPQTADLVWGSVAISEPPVVPDGTVQLQAGGDRWVSDELTAWLDSIPDNEITVSVTGSVTMQAWGYYAPQADGESKTWVRRELYEYLLADASGSTAGDLSYWTFTALDGANETGSISTFVLTFDLLSTPVLTVDVSSRTYAGYGGFPLSRFGTATDWVINSQSTTNAFDIWNNEAIAWRGTYGGARTITSPTVGDAAYTVTISSATLGISNVTITFNVRDDIIDVRPSPARDSATVSPYNQFMKVLKDGDSAGNIYWGDRIVCREGTFNPTAADQTIASKQPTQKVGGPLAPTAPFGTNSAESWEYADGWNPGWIIITGDLPMQTRFRAERINVQNLTNTKPAYRFTGLNLYKGTDSASNTTFYIRDDGGTTRGVHYVAFDHNYDMSLYNEEGGYSTAWIMAYNDWDRERAPLGSVSILGGAYTDSQIIGNVVRNAPVDVFGHFFINSTEGNGRSRFCFNMSVDKKVTFQGHPDFYMPSATSVHAPYKAIAAGGTVDIGYEIGNIATMNRGYLITEADVYVRKVYTSGSPATFTAGETVQTSGGAKQMTISTILTTTEFMAQQTVGSPFSPGEVITGLTSGATATVSNTLFWTGSSSAGSTPPTLADIGKVCNDNHGFFANSPSVAPNTGCYRSGLAGHKFVRAANFLELCDTQAMINQPPATTGAYFVNNVTTFPWGINDQTGVSGAYFEKGRFLPGTVNLVPTAHSAAGAGSISARNVLVCGSSTTVGGSYAVSNNITGVRYGSPGGSISTVPANVRVDFNNPVACGTYTDLRDIISAWTPPVGSYLRSQGTAEIFGCFDTGMVDFRRHTFDIARLTTYS